MHTSKFNVHHVLIVLVLVVAGLFFFGSTANTVSSQAAAGGSTPDPGGDFPPVPSCNPICQLPECKDLGAIDMCANVCPEPWAPLHTTGPVQQCAQLCVIDALQNGADACIGDFDSNEDEDKICIPGETKCGIGPTIQTRMHNNGGPHYVATCSANGNLWTFKACPQNYKCKVVNGIAGCSW